MSRCGVVFLDLISLGVSVGKGKNSPQFFCFSVSRLYNVTLFTIML